MASARTAIIGIEWQRRQHQRSVLALLGLITLVAGAAVAAPPAAPLAAAEASAPVTRAVEVEPPAGRARAVPRGDAQRRYWAAIEPHLAGRARLALRDHSGHSPATQRRAAWLRRFLRPPTPAPSVA